MRHIPNLKNRGIWNFFYKKANTSIIFKLKDTCRTKIEILVYEPYPLLKTFVYFELARMI